MKFLKKIYQERYFNREQNKLNNLSKSISYPLDFSQIKNAVIIFSEGHDQKGLVPIIKSNIQKNWKWMNIYMIHCGKFQKEELTFWGFLNEQATGKFKKLNGSVMFSLLANDDIIGKYLLTVIPSIFTIGIYSEHFNRQFCNIVLKSSKDFRKHPSQDDGKKLFESLLQLQKNKGIKV